MKNKKILITVVSILALFASIFFWWQSTSFSKEVLKLEILGKSEVSLGESVEYVVRYKNNGNVRLEEPELIFEYPKEAIIDGEKILLLDEEDLGGSIYPGQEKTFTFRARLLGQEGSLRIAKATLSFKIKDLNVRNEVSTEFLSTIKEVPINLDFNLPSQITSTDKAFSFSVNYASEVAYALEDLSIIVNYPEDFEFLYSSPKALDENQWDIDSLAQYQSGKIELSGIKKNANQSAFTVKLGIWKNNEFVVLKEITSWLKVVSPSLYITQKVNNAYDYIAKVGDSLHFEISFRNIGDEALTDLILISKLDGNLYDLNTVNAPLAKYTLGDNSIIFEAKNFSKLAYLDTDETGVIEFFVDLKKDLDKNTLAQTNQKVKNIVTLGGAKEEFITKMETILTAKQYIDTSNQYLQSSGPYPLQKNKTSKVTIVWEILNTFNDVGGVKMRAIIPENGTFIKEESQEENGLTFNEETSELVWDVGTVPAGSGQTKESKKIAFQIILSPEIIVPGGILILPGAHVSGNDEWTLKTVEYKTEELKGEMVGGNVAN